VVLFTAPPEKETSTPAPPTSSSAGGGGGELGEDMLQMALRMASEMTDEPVMDLENSLEPVAVNTGSITVVVTNLKKIVYFSF
jgi:hypothetical protein